MPGRLIKKWAYGVCGHEGLVLKFSTSDRGSNRPFRGSESRRDSSRFPRLMRPPWPDSSSIRLLLQNGAKQRQNHSIHNNPLRLRLLLHLLDHFATPSSLTYLPPSIHMWLGGGVSFREVVAIWSAKIDSPCQLELQAAYPVLKIHQQW